MKDEKITKTAYIANSGGLLGLCMGFSLGNQNYYLETLIAFVRRTIFSFLISNFKVLSMSLLILFKFHSVKCYTHFQFQKFIKRFNFFLIFQFLTY